MRILTIVLCLIAFAGTASAAAPRAGVYGNVQYIEEAGDLVGTKVDFRPGPKPVVVVTFCEGDCEASKTLPVTIRGRRILFTVSDEYPARHYEGIFRADGTLSLRMIGSRDKPEILRHLTGRQARD